MYSYKRISFSSGFNYQQLSSTSKQRRVPASRVSRLVTFGGLAVGLGIGTMTEVTKRSLGLSETKKGKSLLDTSAIFTEANAQRIVDTLCRVRGKSSIVLN